LDASELLFRLDGRAHLALHKETPELSRAIEASYLRFRSRANRMDLHLAISLNDEEVLFGSELTVELGVPGVDTERRGVTQLVGSSHDDEVRHPDASDDHGRDLLVPATDEKALRAHRAQHEFRGRMCVEELQKSLLV